MAQPQLDISIGPDGKLKVKVSGVSGEECSRLADVVKEIVGHEESRQPTDEFYGSIHSTQSSQSTQQSHQKSRFTDLK